MKKDNIEDCCQEKMSCGDHNHDCFHGKHHGHNHSCGCGGQSNAVYGLGVVGALFYFLQGAGTFSLVITGIGKAIFWPAILMFKLLTYLNI